MKCLKFCNLGSLVFGVWKNLLRIIRKYSQDNKRCLRADGFPLLPSALRPRLLGNGGEKSFNVARIVALSTILGISSLFSLTSSNIALADSLTLTIPSNPLSLNLNPAEDNGFASTSGIFNVKTDNSSGYTVSIKSKNESGDNSLINGNNRLTSITETTTEDDFKSNPKFINMWGWLPNKLNSADNTNYQIAPGIEEIVLDQTEEANEAGQDYNISLAAKTGNNIPSGQYKNTFIISASANIPPPTTMQEFGDYCNIMRENQTLNLIDTRDNNEYTVAKLKDGKCWMTQNLKIQNITISSEDSNTTKTFTIPASYTISKLGNQSTTTYIYVDSEDDNSVYYSWYTATTGLPTADPYLHRQNSINSICPRSWYLPTNDDFNNLIANYTIDTIQATPANFALSGYYDWRGHLDAGASGRYWSSTRIGPIVPTGNRMTYYLYLNSSGFGTDYDDWFRLHPVRCIAGNVKEHHINYDLKGGEGGPSSNPQVVKMVGDKDEVQISNNSPTRPGYVFKGWCDIDTVDGEDCSGTLHWPQDIIDINSDITLYAVWLYEPKDLGPLGTMQNFDCSSLAYINYYGTTTDSRDNNQYKVAKLMDGKCWMIQNLRIIDTTIDSAASDINEGTFTIPASNIDNFKTANAFDMINAAYYNNNEDDGAYYTIYTASAGINNWNGSSFHTPTSICPKGWKLPSNDDFENLDKAMGGDGTFGSGAAGINKYIASPVPNFIRPGYINYKDATITNYGTYGYYWSDTKRGYDSIYALQLENNSVDAAFYDIPMAHGSSIRCIHRE